MAELRAGSRHSRMRGLRLCGVPRASSMASLSPKTPCGGFQVHNCLRNFETTCLDTVFNVSLNRDAVVSWSGRVSLMLGCHTGHRPRKNNALGYFILYTYL